MEIKELNSEIDWTDPMQVVDIWEQTKGEIQEKLNLSGPKIENRVRWLIKGAVKAKGLPEGWVDRMWEAMRRFN